MIPRIRDAVPPGAILYLVLAPLSTFVTSTTAPLLPTLRDAFSLDAHKVGLLASISGVGMVLIDLPAGRLIHRLGTLRVALLGLIPMTLGPLLMAMAGSYVQLLVGSAFSGIGFAMLLSNNIAAFSAVSSNRKLGARMGLLSTAQLLGAAAGPIVSGTMASLVSWRASYALASLLAVSGVLVALWQYPRTSDIRGASGPSSEREIPAKTRSRSIRPRLAVAVGPIVLVSFLYFVCIYSRSAAMSFLLPIVGRDEANLSIQAIGVLLGSAMLLNMAATLPAGLVADQFGAKRVLLGGLILLMIGETLIFLTPHALGVAVAAVFFGLAGPSSSLTYTLFGEISRESSSPRSLGGFRLSGDSGAVLGPLSMGLLLGQLGYRPALLLVLAVGALALVLLAKEIWFGRQVEVILEPGR